LSSLVLLGGGHANVEVLAQFARRPLAGVRITLVTRQVHTPYSGMLPGLIAGHYRFDEAHIDLQRLSRAAGAHAVFDAAAGIDPGRRTVFCRQSPPVHYDLLSINIGSTPNLSVAGSGEHATPVKPIDRFLDSWDAMCGRLLAADGPRTVAVVGGGAGGVELMLSAQYRLLALLAARGRPDVPLAFHLFTSSPALLPGHHPRVGRLFERILARRGVIVHPGSRIVRVEDRRLVDEHGRAHHADEILWTTQATAPEWLRDGGLAVDEGGFVRVGPTLQSTSHPDVFAAGDVASFAGHDLAKSGVYAVRQGEVLAPNLRRALLRQPLHAFHPQRRTLSLISTGDRYAVGSRGSLSFRGRWVWWWKDAIDRRFMREYQRLGPP
jgi:selenide,water dikinase